MKIVAVALEERMRRKGQENVEVAGRAAVQPRLAFARQADARSFLDAGRNVDGEGAVLLYMTVAATGLAWVAYEPAAAMATRTGALDGEEALLRAYFSRARAGGAVLRFRSGLGAAAGTGLARNGARDADLGVLAAVRFLERDLHVLAEIAAAILPPTAPSAAHDLAEEIVEHVGEGGREIEAEAVGAATAAVFESGVAEAVVGRALLAVLEDVVRLIDFLETDFAGRIAGVAVGVKFLGKLSVGALDLFDRGALLAAQDVVVAALVHGLRPEIRSRKFEIRR